MKLRKYFTLFAILFTTTAIFSFTFHLMGGPYTENELIEPAALAKTLNDPNAKHPVIFNVGSMPLIKNAQSGGMGYSEESFKDLKTLAVKLEKNQPIVLYCGCCKMENCPNVDKPFKYLKSQGFTNVKVLNITTGLMEDWVNKGYPMKK